MNTSFNYHSFMNDIHGKVKSVLDAEYLHGRNCFLDNAFLFLDNAERILGDPRMAIAFRNDLLRRTAETEKALQAVAMDVTASRKEFRAGLKSKEEHTLLMRELNQRRSELTAYLQKNPRKESYLVQIGPPGMIGVKCQPTDKDVEGINTRRFQSSK